MNVAQLTPEQVRKRGYEALLQALGPAGTIRFMLQFDRGSGDYTRERHNWLPDDLETIIEEMRQMRNDLQSNAGSGAAAD